MLITTKIELTNVEFWKTLDVTGRRVSMYGTKVPDRDNDQTETLEEVKQRKRTWRFQFDGLDQDL